jgi:exonuclease SbcC
MKILAVRGENLASLQDPFEVDLVRGPLAGAGLFCITGPTGAGKSTLLDAICLALYDCTPRLDLRAKSPPRIGSEEEDEKDKLRASDPRSLLRRGAVAGWAEVDFMGVDQRAYTARWSVRRARNKPTGRLQAQELSLHARWEEAPLVSGKKTEVKEAIEAKVGLDFAQFRRSVLLAQGDFAAFLEADAEQRACLLERMTGTEIYMKLSQRAYERDKREQEARKLLEARHGDLEILDSETRQALEESRSAVITLRGAQVEARARYARGLDWLRRGETLELALEEAHKKLATAEAGWQELSEERRDMKLLEQAAALRSQVESLDQANRRCQEAEEEYQAREVAANKAREELEACQAVRRKAEKRWEKSLSQERLAAPEIQQARSLDNLKEAALQRKSQAEQVFQVAKGHLEAARRERVRVEAALKQKQGELEACRLWLEENASTSILAEFWSGVSRDLERRAELLPLLRREEEERERLHIKQEKAQEVSTQAQAKLKSSEERVLVLRQETQVVTDQVTALAPAGDVDPLDLLAGTRRGLEALVEGLELRERLKQELEEQGIERARWESELEQVQRREAAAIGEAELLLPRLDEARRALELWRQAQDLEDRRLQLVTGEPCPLCGSLDHPWSSGEGIPASQQDRVRELEAERKRLEENEKEAARQAEVLAGKLEAVAARIKEREIRLRDQGETWRDSHQRAEAGMPLDPEASGVMQTVTRRLEQVCEQEQTLGRFRKELRTLEEKLLKARDDRESAQREAIEAEKALDAARLERETHRSEGEAREREDRRLEEGLKEYFSVEELGEKPDRLRSRIQLRVEEFRSRRASREDLERTLQPLHGELGSLQNQEDQRTQEVERARSELEISQEESRRRVAARMEVLGGESVEDFTNRLRREVEESQAVKDRARKSDSAAQQAREVASVRQEEAQRRRKADRRAREGATRDLAAALAEAGLVEEVLRELLGRAHHEFETLREKIRSQEQVRETCREQLILREKDHQEHLAGEVPTEAQEVTREDLEARLEEVGENIQGFDQELGKLQEQLRKDAEARKKGQELLGELEEQQRRCQLWGSLKELIGSADGKKFRTFAQSLTLDCLLEQANIHLQELAPRYRLQRIPGAEMDLQVVDRDLGDELRSVQSLSGGEGFLVSLALALGLSSLASSHTRVESLFVDEGFGSLDAKSLDRALDALQALQATGRQVGVISHVSGLAERIGVEVRVVRQGTGRSRVEV